MFHSDELTVALRSHLARHRWQVVAFSLAALLAAVLLWLALYAVAYWLTLFGLTVVRGGDAAIPPTFTVGFLLAAGTLLILAWMHRQLAPERLPPDQKVWAAILLDFVLAIPRATLAVWDNLSAWQQLSEAELGLAADLIEQVAHAQRLPLQSAPLAIPDDRAREKIIFTLLLLQILEVRHDEAVHWLRLSPRRPESIQTLTERTRADS